MLSLSWLVFTKVSAGAEPLVYNFQSGAAGPRLSYYHRVFGHTGNNFESVAVGEVPSGQSESSVRVDRRYEDLL